MKPLVSPLVARDALLALRVWVTGQWPECNDHLATSMSNRANSAGSNSTMSTSESLKHTPFSPLSCSGRTRPATAAVTVEMATAANAMRAATVPIACVPVLRELALDNVRVASVGAPPQQGGTSSYGEGLPLA